MTLVGELLDPRPAYAAADVIVGMGGSALRGAAFVKPVIIVGAKGFSAPLTPRTADYFYYYGIYGNGDNNSSNARMVSDICFFAEAREKLPEFGAFSRQFVLDHFALEKICAQLEAYLQAVTQKRRKIFIAAADGARIMARLKLSQFVPNGVHRILRDRRDNVPVQQIEAGCANLAGAFHGRGRGGSVAR